MVQINFFSERGDIGGNQVLLSHKDEKLWLDFGLSFKKTSRFINQLLEGRQLPKMRLQELSKQGIIPPTEFLQEPFRVLTSHAHHDHFGALFAPLEHNIKVELFAPEDTLALIKARMEVSAAGGLFGKAEVIPVPVEKKISISGFEVVPIVVDHSIDGSYSYLIFCPDGTCTYYTGDIRFDLTTSDQTLETIGEYADKVDVLVT